LVTLSTRVTRRIGEKVYVKSTITIPHNFVEDLGRTGDNKLILTPAQPILKANSFTFESFAEAVEKALAKAPAGLPWSKIREILNLPYRSPNPLWVHRLENERGLKRARDSKTSKIIWKLG